CGSVVWPWLSSFESPAHPVKSLTSTCPAPGAHSTDAHRLAKFEHGRYDADEAKAATRRPGPSPAVGAWSFAVGVPYAERENMKEMKGLNGGYSKHCQRSKPGRCRPRTIINGDFRGICPKKKFFSMPRSPRFESNLKYRPVHRHEATCRVPCVAWALL